MGGISEYLRIVDLAETKSVVLMPHSPYFGPGFFASLQIAAARGSITALEYNFVKPDAWLADVEGLRRGEMISVSELPGLGFEPDLDVLKKFGRKLSERIQ